MTAPTIQDLTAQVRLESGLRNNQVWTDAQIQSVLSEAYSDLRDRMIIRFAYWFRQEVTFTLAGGTDSVFDLTTVPDLQMVQGLDLNVSPDVWATVTMLGSYQERNALNGTWPFPQTWSYNGSLGRRYWIDGDRLEVLPGQNAAGTYRLVYTPIQMLLAKQTVNLTVQPGDIFFNNSGKLSFLFAQNSFIPDYVGGQLTVNLSAPNTAYNGTYTVAPTLAGSTAVNTTATYAGGTTTFPAAGTATIVYQPLSTTDTLPIKLVPWQQYLVLYASVSVAVSRKEDITALDARYQDIRARVISLTKQRSEGLKQAPITSNRYGRVGWGSGNGGW